MVVRVVFILASLGIVQCNLIQSCDMTKEFVDRHNELRFNLTKGLVPGQPAAAKMNLIVWDDELAAKASKWAAGQKFMHNPDLTIPSNRFSRVGENIFSSYTSDMNAKFDPKEAMDAWWDEYKDFKYHKLVAGDIGVPGRKQIGHYTQMAWSASTRLGCGVSQYVENGLNTFLAVCDYGPAGNMRGEAPYEIGKPSGTLLCQEADCNKQYGDKCRFPQQ